MALRLLLVGLVVGLGFDLPGGDEMAAWARSGVAWVQARIDGLVGPEAVVEAEPVSDEAFSAIVDDMAKVFSADLARAEAPTPRRAVAFEPVDVPDDLEPGVAFALNRAAQGAGAAEEPAAEAESSGDESRPNQLASAVRLTRQAVAAWMSVLRGAEVARSVIH